MCCTHVKAWLGAPHTSWSWQPVVDLLLGSGSSGSGRAGMGPWSLSSADFTSLLNMQPPRRHLDQANCFLWGFADLGTTEAPDQTDSQILVPERIR